MAEDSEPGQWWQQSGRWANFGAAVILVGLFPLIPLAFQLGFTGEISSDSLMITAALYGLAVALTSRNPLMFALFIGFTIVAAGFYGHVAPASSDTHHVLGTVAGIRLSATSEGNVSLGNVFFWALLGPFAAVVGQRFLRHLRRGEVFFEFVNPGG